MAKTIQLEIHRQKDKNSPAHFETFEVPYRPNMNVISALMEIRKKPVTTDSKTVEPPAWEAACLEEVCGSCTMNVNGKIRQSCTALIDDVSEKRGEKLYIKLEPMKKFPLVRDLVVDRSSMFKNLIKIKGWVPIDGSYDLGMAPPQDDNVRRLRYELSRCMSCGCCLEACPQVNEKSTFIGPAAIAQTLLFNTHPVGKSLENERLDVMTSREGITGCGNAQNCVKVCPKEVPLLTAIAQINRDTTVYKIKRWMGWKN
jgi:succinate dehydrogenase / fumarate reductase iron-sulfur subunit